MYFGNFQLLVYIFIKHYYINFIFLLSLDVLNEKKKIIAIFVNFILNGGRRQMSTNFVILS